MAERSREVNQMLPCLPSGEQALAYGAWAAGVRVVTGYPGSPSSGVVKHLLAISTPDEMHIQWSANEKVAVETALGASLAGQRALVCMKSVGLNVALDPLMTARLTGVRGGLVIVVGDDPGAWASQNEQDSRYLAAFAELPLMEPSSPVEAASMMTAAYDLSEETGLPVVVRETREFSQQRGAVSPLPRLAAPPPNFIAQGLEWVSLPFNVVANHRRLHERAAGVAALFESSPLNVTQGEGSMGVLAAGFAHTKTLRALPEGIPSGVGLLKLGTLWPLPEEFLAAFVADKRDILIVEDTEPYVEVQLRALAQRMGWTLGIQGKQTGQLPREGALTARQIRAAIAALGGRSLPPFVGGGDHQETRPSQQGLCEGCFYVPLFEALRDALAETERGAVICADPGCSIRIHQPPFEMLHVKHCMGSAIGLALGLWLAGVDELPIALVGDSSFFHSGLNGLLSAVASDAGIIALILDNGSAALTGGQPHPGSGRDARGGRAPAAQLETVLRSCGVHHLDVIESPDYSAARRVFRNALATQGLRVVIGRGECIRASQRA